VSCIAAVLVPAGVCGCMIACRHCSSCDDASHELQALLAEMLPAVRCGRQAVAQHPACRGLHPPCKKAHRTTPDGCASATAANVDHARELLGTELAALVGESYERAYGDMVRVQQLTELEEVIRYSQLGADCAPFDEFPMSCSIPWVLPPTLNPFSSWQSWRRSSATPSSTPTCAFLLCPLTVVLLKFHQECFQQLTELEEVVRYFQLHADSAPFIMSSSCVPLASVLPRL
jgi:FAT domain